MLVPIKMTDSVVTVTKGRKSPSGQGEDELASTSKRPRTAEDFYLFCSFILEYENYDVLKKEEIGENIDSPMGSTGSAVDSITDSLADSREHSPTQNLGDNLKTERNSANAVDDSSSPGEVKTSDADTDEDSYDLVTCYCAKPFAGRAMIECSKCLTWIHLSCAKIKKNNIPDVFICIKCRNHKVNNIPSNSSVKTKKRVSV